MRGLTRYDRYFLPLFAGTVGLAWVALLLWDMSPYSRYLYHDWTRRDCLPASAPPFRAERSWSPA